MQAAWILMQPVVWSGTEGGQSRASGSRESQHRGFRFIQALRRSQRGRGPANAKGWTEMAFLNELKWPFAKCRKSRDVAPTTVQAKDYHSVGWGEECDRGYTGERQDLLTYTVSWERSSFPWPQCQGTSRFLHNDTIMLLMVIMSSQWDTAQAGTGWVTTLGRFSCRAMSAVGLEVIWVATIIRHKQETLCWVKKEKNPALSCCRMTLSRLWDKQRKALEGHLVAPVKGTRYKLSLCLQIPTLHSLKYGRRHH